MTVQGGRIRIEIGFGFNANLQEVAGENPPFTLDDPVLGELDSAELPGGDVWVDVSEWFIDGLEIARIRNRQLDLFTAGRASFRLNNRVRLFDPTNEVGPFFGQLTPMRPVRISAIVEGTEVRLFVGFITDWTFRYARPDDAWVDVECVDAFVLFAADTLAPGGPEGDGEKAGARIGRLLTATGFGPQRSLSEGIYPLAETLFNDNALALMQEAALSDFGLLFVARDGTVTYRTPFDAGTDPTITFTQANVTVPGVRYHGIELNTSSELLYNVVTVTWDAGTETSEDATSIERFLPRTLPVRTSLQSSFDAQLLGEFVLSLYAEPQSRIRNITVKMHDRRLSVADRLQVARLDIGDLIRVLRIPPGAVSPVEVDASVEGVSWSFSRDTWTGTFTLGDPTVEFVFEPLLFSFGSNSNGQVGTDTVAFLPTQVGTSVDWEDVSAGSAHSVAVRDGRLFSFGSNGQGRTGLGTTSGNTTVPTQVGTDADWTAVAAGNQHSVAIRDGRLFSFGLNGNGRTGLGTDSGVTTVPTQVGTDTDWVAVSAGSVHSLAIRDGRLYSFGANSDGQTGLGTTSGDTTVPTQVGADTDWVSISAGGFHSLAVRDGKLFSFGANANGQTGLGTTSGVTTTPTQVGSNTDWIAASGGIAHSLAVRDGKLFSFGFNGSHRTGQGTDSGNTIVPTQVGTDTGWTAVAAGDTHSLGINDGRMLSFGSNLDAKTGLGIASGNTTVPTQGVASRSWTVISAGVNHSLAIETRRTRA